ncbi:MAG: REP-associated tyrosine transposase [Gaiellaceae bacterium]|jgi:REP element-mobilizing transposase RayT|nr:REP-associated tyrosine transposase [Gaiellaceae bacterium]
MPSRPRDFTPGIHHVWVNATGNWPYFVDEVDRMAWIRLLVHVLDRYDWKCLVFCQMTTHVHLLVHVPDESLPFGMAHLSREYSKQFNDRHARSGYFVRKRYGSRRIDDARDLLGAYAYVVLNPVREAMCRRAEEWRWCSYGTTIGKSDAFPFVDAAIVLAELGGSVAALELLIEARARDAVSKSHVR